MTEPTHGPALLWSHLRLGNAAIITRFNGFAQRHTHVLKRNAALGGVRATRDKSSPRRTTIQARLSSAGRFAANMAATAHNAREGYSFHRADWS